MSFAPLADGHPFAIMAFTVRDGVVVEIAVLADPARVPAPAI